MKIAIDTNRYSDLARMDPSVIAFLKTVDSIAMPLIVDGELRAGFNRGARRKLNESQLENFLSLPNVSLLLPDEATSVIYGELVFHLQSSGRTIPTNDLWIASMAVQHDLTLYTRDAHFQRIISLRVI